MNRNNLIIIIPAYNEAGRIGRTIAGIKGAIDADIVVVSDGSKDSTAEEARSAGAFVVELPFNLGYGAALQTGYKYALKRGYRFAVQMDADGQHDPSSIKKLLDPVVGGEVDIAIGSRFLERDSLAGWPFARRVGIVFFSTIISILTGRKITDATSGFQALNEKVLEFYSGPYYPADYPDADVILALHRRGFRFEEVPVLMHKAPSKVSMHAGIKPVFYVFKMLLSIFVTLIRKEEHL